MKYTRKQQLIGRRIVAVDWRPFDTGRPLIAGAGARMTHNPILYLDNGTALQFTVEETEVGEYGVRIGISRQTPPNRPIGRVP